MNNYLTGVVSGGVWVLCIDGTIKFFGSGFLADEITNGMGLGIMALLVVNVSLYFSKGIKGFFKGLMKK